MNKIEQFEQLMALARHERAPAIYVVAPVLDEVRARSYISLTPTRPLAIFTGLSLSARRWWSCWRCRPGSRNSIRWLLCLNRWPVCFNNR